MRIIADLHLHGRFSRATSKNLTLQNLEKYAKVKGITLMGTGDFTHPQWIQEIKENLSEDGTGILKTKSGFPFMLTTEISLVYTQDGKGRRIHHIVWAPNLEVVQHITEYLLTKGRVDYDGRPIFKIPSDEFVERLKSIHKDIEIIPAHAWTPYFGLFGSMTGFDSIQECFKDQTKHINAIETGLSSDPPMNWRLSQLDNIALVSFPDLHSFWPWRIGREATIFELPKLAYQGIINGLKSKTVAGTIEVDPGYGKYHFDGHRACKVCMHPKDSLKSNNLCPQCKTTMTIGVLNRVEQLAGRPEGFKLKNAPPFHSIIPLSEIVAQVTGKPIASKLIWQEYYKLVTAGRTEYEILLNTPHEELSTSVDQRIADAIMKNREGKIEIQPGYDGEYGVPVFDKSQMINLTKSTQIQKGLGDF